MSAVRRFVVCAGAAGFLALVGVHAVAPTLAAGDRQTPQKAPAPVALADVKIENIHAWPCLCGDDVARYFHAFAPNNLHVFVTNASATAVKARVTVRYYSLYRSPGQWNELSPRDVDLPAKASNKMVVFWSKNYYDLVSVDRDKSKPLTARIEILDKNVREPNTADNELSITACQTYVY